MVRWEDDWKLVALGMHWKDWISQGADTLNLSTAQDKCRLHPGCQDTVGVKAVTELDNGGSNQGSADRDAKNQILDYGETIHRFQSFQDNHKGV